MKIDPDRAITITIPYGMIEQLKRAKPILSMFRDEGDVSGIIDIIDAIHAGALEFIREEEGEIRSLLDEDEENDLLDLDKGDEDSGRTKH
jgi:hypothetical protein